MGEPSEEYEILDLSEYRNKDWVQKMFGDITKQSAAKQVVVGAAGGWFAGFLFIKVGKMAAASLGTTILLVQLAQHQGYIRVNWNKVEQGVNRAKEELHKEANKRYPGILQNTKKFLQQNVLLAGSFAGGFLFGVAF
ncbi:FUN14 domain-containing protein 1-like [Haliotis asinina]|uniref:FUN14 domain-containing protein 1-like n=1 Tax=Haliotis asinina TaxID=109174 RepID=UPI00353270AB